MPKLSDSFVHLGLGATSTPQPPFDGMQWYADYGARVASDGDEGRLVSMGTSTSSWKHWEMHPHGSEVVVCTAGRMTLVQEVDGREQRTVLEVGDYVINPPGVWHTADVDDGEKATALFITSGRGTEHRQR